MSVIVSDSAIHAVLIDWTLGRRQGSRASARRFLEFVRSRNDKIPIFLMAERGEASAIPIEVMEMVDEFIWTLEDTAAFVGGRVVGGHPALSRGDAAAAGRGADEVHPGVRVLVAHAGPHGRHRVPQVAGRPDLLRLLRREPAALRPLDQRRQPRLAARSHGPDRRAREVRGARVRRASHLLRHQRHVDVEPRDLHGGRRPRPDRAVRSQLPQVDRAQPGHDRRHPELPRAAAQPLRDHRPDPAGRGSARKRSRPRSRRTRSCTKGIDTRAVYSVVTNSTYDGLCYNARRVEELLDPSVDRIHFDEAWYAYARFNPLYRDRHAMHGDPKDHTGSDGLRHALHAQAAGRALAGVVPAHPRRPQPDPARALQRVVHDARVDVAALSDHRLERHHGRDDGRARRPHAHERVDPGGRRVPADHGPRAPRSSRRSATGSSRPGTRTPSRIRKSRQEDPLRGRSARAARHRSGVLGAASRAKPGTASAISKTATACSTRSRCRSSRRASPTRAASTSAAFRRAWSRRICTTAASRSRRPPTSRSCSCSRSASPRASGARCSTRCSTSSATTTATRRSRRCCRSSSTAIRRVRRPRAARPRRPDVRAAAASRGRRTGWPRRSRRCRRRS